MKRTVCACERCVACCKRQPGPLIPGDFERIASFLGESTEQAKRHFIASRGALIGMRGGGVVRVPTITPARKADGSCVFLGPDDRCKIHPVSPFGCAYLDMHMNKKEADKRSLYAITKQCDPAYQNLRVRISQQKGIAGDTNNNGENKHG